MCMCIHDDGCHLRRYAENRHLSAGCFFPLFRALFVLCVQCGVPSHTGNNQKIFCNIRVVYSFTSAFLNLSVFASSIKFFVVAFLSGKHWGPLAAFLAYPHMKFIIDKFHSLGHVDSWCAETCAQLAGECAPGRRP